MKQRLSSSAAAYHLLGMVVGLFFVASYCAGSSTASPLQRSPPSTSFRIVSAEAAADLQALIDPPCGNETATTEWLAADSSMSFEIRDGVYAWLFGDTLLGSTSGYSESPNCTRNIHYFIHDTIGLINVSRSDAVRIDKHYQVVNNTPIAIFNDPSNSSLFYWLIAGQTLAPDYDMIVIAADVIIFTQGGLGFSGVGSSLFVVNSPLDTPVGEWQSTTNIIDLPHSGDKAKLTFSNGLTVAEDELGTKWLYIWGTKQLGYGAASTIVARVSVFDVANNNVLDGIQYLQINATDSEVYWATPDQFDFDQLYSIEGLTGQPEVTIQYNEELSLWFTWSLAFGAFDIYLYTSPNITGPYTQYPTAVYTIPPPMSTIKGGFCYAIKSHPELAGPQGFVITYNCNGGDWQYILENVYQFYVPQMVRIQFVAN